MRVWVDASTLIALDAVGEATVLRDLLGHVSITREIEREVFNARESRILGEAKGAWIEIHGAPGDPRRWRGLGLAAGESSLFATPQGDRLVLDEVAARTAAEAEGRDYVGLLGLLLEGAREGRITSERARHVVQALARSGFRISTDLYDGFLRELENLGGQHRRSRHP